MFAGVIFFLDALIYSRKSFLADIRKTGVNLLYPEIKQLRLSDRVKKPTRDHRVLSALLTY